MHFNHTTSFFTLLTYFAGYLNQKMKILFISNFSKTPSNTRSEKETLVALAGMGPEIVVMTAKKTEVTDSMEQHGIKFVFHDIPGKISLSTIRFIRQTIVAGDFDIIHMTFARAVSNGLVASRGLKIKRVVYYGSMMLHWHDPTAWLTYLNPAVDRIICVSEAVADHVRKQLPRKYAYKPVRVYRGFNPDWNNSLEHATRESLDIPKDAFVVGCVTNVRPVKGLKYFIGSADHLPEGLPVYFIIIGNRTTSKKFMKQIGKTRYSDHFRVLGVKRYPQEYISMCDLYVQPSLTEGLGRSIIEAMSLGVPAIVTEIGGAVEVVDHGKCGMVVPPANSSAIAEGISYFHSNHDLLIRLSAESKERIRDHFNLKDTIEGYYNIYSDLCSSS